MTEFILIICGLAFGAGCFFVGYGIAKKKKIAGQVAEIAGDASKKIGEAAESAAGAVSNASKKV